MGASSSEQVYHGPRSRVSPTVMLGGEEVRVSNVYVREEWTDYKEGLAERLPSGVYRVYAENEVGSTKLPVPVNEDFKP